MIIQTQIDVSNEMSMNFSQYYYSNLIKQDHRSSLPSRMITNIGIVTVAEVTRALKFCTPLAFIEVYTYILLQIVTL